MVIFCQMDVTGRTDNDPAADALSRNILRHVAGGPSPGRKIVYVGEPAGKLTCKHRGFAAGEFNKDTLKPDSVLIVGPGGGKPLAGEVGTIADFLKAGGRMLAVGLDADEAKACLPFGVVMKKSEYIGAAFAAPGVKSLLAGVGPGDVHNRDPRVLNLVELEPTVLGDGVLAQSGNVVFLTAAFRSAMMN